MILGGGDVLMAAETGSGKTGVYFENLLFKLLFKFKMSFFFNLGAFCLPVIQIVFETLKDIQEHKGMGKSDTKKNAPVGFKMSFYDRTPSMGKLNRKNLKHKLKNV